MTRGIQVISTGECDSATKPEEIEFSHGFDVEDIDQIPQFTRVPTMWPRREGGTFVEYYVKTIWKLGKSGEIRLSVRYVGAANEHLVREWGDVID